MSTSPPRVRTRKSPQQRSAEIHDAAIALAREEGLAALTLRAIAHRAGVAPGLVAHYAGGMDELVARTFGRLVLGELDDVRAEVEGASTPAAQLAMLFATVLGRDHDDITLVWVDAWSLGRINPALAAAIDEHMAGWQSFIAGIVRGGRGGGEFQTDDPDAVAWQLLAMIDGLSAHALTRGTDAAEFVHRLAQASETLVGAEPGAVTGRLP
jgi:AcrR family transcriptional regulator